jgi:hypothetical protein
LVALTARLLDDASAASPLPFLGDALKRFLEEFPSTTNGLSRTANTSLRLLREHGTLPSRELFKRSQAREARFFLGDGTFFAMLHRLAAARVPLVSLDGDRVSLTDAGQRVARHEDDAVRLNGIDEWRGGVHLAGSEAAWRWDPARETLISCG